MHTYALFFRYSHQTFEYLVLFSVPRCGFPPKIPLRPLRILRRLARSISRLQTRPRAPIRGQSRSLDRRGHGPRIEHRRSIYQFGEWRTPAKVAWPSGLRRWFKAPVSSEAWVRIPPLPQNSFILLIYFNQSNCIKRHRFCIFDINFSIIMSGNYGFKKCY